MRIDIVTIFPEFFGALNVSLLGKARERGLVDLRVLDLREFTTDAHRTVDDAPFGGGPGMVMRPEPWYAAFRNLIHGNGPAPRPRVVVTSPAGRPLTHQLAEELAAEPWLAIACGRYEGIDERVVDQWADDVVSIGDYVLAGGEVAALVIIEAVTRLLPGVVGNAESVDDDSHVDGLLEGPVYTRPAVFEGREAPPVLLSGDHAAIKRWRRDQSLRRTAQRRPDLLRQIYLDERDRSALRRLLGELRLPAVGEDVAE